MRSQIFAGLALGVVAMVAGAPVTEERVTVDNASFGRKDGNNNDNWDTLTGVSLTLITPSGDVSCEANSFPDPSLPSNVYTCADPAYSFQITGRPGYDLYAFKISHKVSDSVTLTGTTNVGCNGPIPMACGQTRTREAVLTAA